MPTKRYGKKTWFIPCKDYSIIFDRLEAGTLRVDIETCTVEVLFHGKWRIPFISTDVGGYQFIDIYYQGKRRRVGLARLFYMVANGVENIPDGYDVAHDDDNNQHNHYSNLSLKTKKENRHNGTSFSSSENEEF